MMNASHGINLGAGRTSDPYERSSLRHIAMVHTPAHVPLIPLASDKTGRVRGSLSVAEHGELVSGDWSTEVRRVGDTALRTGRAQSRTVACRPRGFVSARPLRHDVQPATAP